MTRVAEKRAKKGSHSGETKISVRIHRRLLETFNSKVEKACLRRDSYLNAVLERELPFLDHEICVANSEQAQQFVTAQLRRRLGDLVLVSVALRTAIAEQLNGICTRKRIVRDAFFNRLFILLTATPNDLDLLLSLGDGKDGWDSGGWRGEVWSEYRNDGPSVQNLFSPLDPDIDPLWALHMAFEIYARRNVIAEDYVDPKTGKTLRVTRGLTGAVVPVPGVYSTELRVPRQKKDLLYMSCFVSDWQIPGTTAEKSARQVTDDLLKELEVL